MDPYMVPKIRSKHLLCYPLPVDSFRQSRFLHLQTTHKPRLLNIKVELYIVHFILLFSWCFIALLYFNKIIYLNFSALLTFFHGSINRVVVHYDWGCPLGGKY